MTTPDQVAQGWSDVADAYDRGIAPFLTQYARDALDAAGAREGARVLDVAAGSGALSLEAARRGARVLATDFAPGMIERLRAKAAAQGLPVEAEVMDGQALDVDEGAFDAACSNFGLIFFPDRAAGFRGMRRALREGGRAVVTAWSAPDRIEWFTMFYAGMREVAPDLPPPPSPPPIFSLADPARLRAEMEEAGFRDVRVTTVRHAWEMPSPEEAWASLATTNPVMPAMMARLGEKRVEALRETLLRRLREAADADGRVRMRGDAHVGVGVR